ncbi:MAG TPA: sigma-70 family RNA polymerase sigma factor [Actinomycetota bacterium]|nr:sigma-70 family RNA polymerase sigma factor [Actinomycetota bacterium]
MRTCGRASRPCRGVPPGLFGKRGRDAVKPFASRTTWTTGSAFRYSKKFKGEDLEFDEFCRTEYQSVFRAACLATGNSDVASDATQEAFGRAYARWSRLSKHPWAGGWVTTTALNLCRKELRRRSRAATGPTAEDRRPRDLAQELDVVAALGTLPFRQREAVVLFYWSDLPTAAIAELMSISESAVRAHLTHARAALRKTLEVNHA